MTSLLDADVILSGNEHWMKLDQEWGIPVDLDTEDDVPPKLSPVYSTLDLRKTTFDSPGVFQKGRRKVGRRFSKKSIEYNDFLLDLEEEGRKELPLKHFYYISGQILSALSVEEICEQIDDIFKSVDKLCSATSTIRQRKVVKIPGIVQCSISATDLSFDDTTNDSEKEKSDNDIDGYIDEAFDHLNATIASLPSPINNQSTRESVTSLVRKFSGILNSPVVNCNSKRRRQCSDRFNDLIVFWNKKVLEGSD